MEITAAIRSKYFQPAIGASLAALCGLLLWSMPVFDAWVRASYDCVFRFQWGADTNQLVLVLMDNAAHESLHQKRGEWDRMWHARLANKLADDGAALVVFDVHFRLLRDPVSDEALAAGLRRCQKVALMAKYVAASRPDASHPGFDSVGPILPAEKFLAAAKNNWGAGVANDDEPDFVVRRHWPYPAPGHLKSLPWVAAELAGAVLPETPRRQWLRYYGQQGAWNALSFHSALDQPTNYFRDKIVFIGSQPQTPNADGEEDEFRTPYTAQTRDSTSGVEILATTFLNLMHHEWLERLPAWGEALLLLFLGGGIGAVLPLLRPRDAVVFTGLVGLAALVGFLWLAYATQYWFPWLIVVGGQIPCAAVTYASFRLRDRAVLIPGAAPAKSTEPIADLGLLMLAPSPEVPDAPGYELIQPPFGRGGYGRVWLARNVAGQWQALKAVYLAKFENNPEPYDREFRGIARIKPISKKHPGLLEVDYISPKKAEGYFYYVMELGDGLTPGWEADPSSYRPRDLLNVRAQCPEARMPVGECVRIGLALAETLEFLHGLELTHRDIKPSNIIFVDNQPKLADVGLVTDAHPTREHSLVGTVGYMPSPPEPPGTPSADIYALGMVLYVISTGQAPGLFPTISTTLVQQTDDINYLRLNPIILKACQPELSQRYSSAGEMRTALRQLADLLSHQRTRVV